MVGARPEELERLGYRSVGRDFPVFLHPQTHEEHALARLERKVAPGYRGFTTEFSPSVTLEEDLRRRDLTINAMAESADGELVDPFGGRADLEARVLRHVSDAFVEDPVRILRVARFAARFASLGFTIAPDTLALMQRMTASGEVAALVPERVWQETERALGEARPQVFFETLRACGALKVIFPEVDALFGVPQPPRWHPDVDTGVHAMLALGYAAAQPAAAPQYADLTAWLTSHHLTSGLSGYSQANIVTATSGGTVSLRPVAAAGKYVTARTWNASSTWFDPARHDADFLVLSTFGAYEVSGPDAVATFGRPAKVYRYRDYTILVWHENLLARLR